MFRFSLLARLGLSADLQVCGGLYKAREAVFLHERVDFGLGQTETGQVGLHYVLLCDAFGHMVKIYLQVSRGWREVIIRLCGGSRFTEHRKKSIKAVLYLPLVVHQSR